MIRLPKYGFLAGLPRTGSTLLACILGQNPDVHVSGNSPLARLMLGAYETCESVAHEGLVRVRRTDFKEVLLTAIPRLYYQDVEQKYILEKDRAWSHDPLRFLDYITDDARVVVLLRSIPEIVESFVAVRVRNNDVLPERDLLVPTVDPLVDAIGNTMRALDSEDDRLLFATYDQLVRDPRYFVESVYTHYGWEPFIHNFDNVEDLHLEDDSTFHTQGLHDIRPKLERRKINVKVSAGLMKQTQELDDILWAHVENSIKNTPHRHI